MIVYLARDIPAFVMYCVNGASRSSLLIESTDSKTNKNIKKKFKFHVRMMIDHDVPVKRVWKQGRDVKLLITSLGGDQVIQCSTQ